MSKLFYIIGASGAGKDSLMNYCREQINGALPIVFAHRYITRPANAGGENHVSLTDEEFKLRIQNGLFALHWESHGLCYGIGIEVTIWLQQGMVVIINGSRDYLSTAMEKFPAMQPILIDVDVDLIKARLNGRGRESEESIGERIARNQKLSMDDTDIIRVQNNGTIDEAAQSLLNLILPVVKPALIW